MQKALFPPLKSGNFKRIPNQKIEITEKITDVHSLTAGTDRVRTAVGGVQRARGQLVAIPGEKFVNALIGGRERVAERRRVNSQHERKGYAHGDGFGESVKAVFNAVVNRNIGCGIPVRNRFSGDGSGKRVFGRR